MRAKYFMVLTDKASALMLEGVDPKTIRDQVMLEHQMTELILFREALEDTIKEHQRAIKKLIRGANVATHGTETTEKTSRKEKRHNTV